MTLRGVILMLGACVTGAMILLHALQTPLIERAQNAIFDGFQRMSPRVYDPQSPVHIIDIDEAALKQFGQWPWPRLYLAELSDRLFDLGAAVVGFDILFSEPDRTSPEVLARSLSRFRKDGSDQPDSGQPSHDSVFAAALARGATVLSLSGGTADWGAIPKAGVAYTGNPPHSALVAYDGAIGNLPNLSASAAGEGVISLGRSRDGIVRSVPMVVDLGGQLVPSLSAELLRVAQGAGGHVLRTSQASGEQSGGTAVPVALRIGAFEAPLDANGRFLVHFAGQQSTRTTSAVEVLSEEVNTSELQDRIAGKIVIVGVSAQGLFDLRTTPLAAQVPGVTVHAEVIEQILSNNFLRRPDWMGGLEVVLVLLSGLGLTLVLARQQTGLSSAMTGVVLFGSLVASGAGFLRFGVLFNPVLPMLTAVLIYLPGATLNLIAKERARRFIRDRFAYFLPPELIAKITANPDAALTPEGADRELSIMFIDMRQFTTVTEKMQPQDVVRLINAYLSAVSDALVARGGTIDKFMGDAVMAFWNAPIEVPNHRWQALYAIAEAQQALDRANIDLQRQGLPQVEICIGLNSGVCSVGLMGSRDRLSYTCIGDAVTLAARYEGLTRRYGVSNCVGPAALEDMPADLVALELDLIAVKGRSEALPVYAVFPADTPGVEDVRALLDIARQAYLHQNWQAACNLFSQLQQMPPVRGFDLPVLCDLYQQRIDAFQMNPPPPNWDGSAVARSK